MKFKIAFYLLGVLITINSFGQKSYSLMGKVDTALNNQYVYLYGIDYSKINPQIRDSFLIKKGQFLFAGQLKTPALLVSLYLKKNRKSFTQLYIENKKISIDLKSEEWYKPENCILKNASISAQYKKWKSATELFSKDIFEMEMKMDSIQQRHPDSSLAEMQNEFNLLKQKEKNLQINYIKEHPDYYFSLQALSYFSFNSLSETPDIFQELYNSLSPELKDLPEGQTLKDKILTLTAIQVGNVAPDFEMVNENGISVKLSDYKGQYLLIDFWASWCVPCIENLPTLKSFYEKNKEKNLKLLSISLDSDKSRWKDAINKHHLNWDNVSELKGWEGKVSKDYNVYAIPKTVLINPAGIIAGIDIDLTQKLDYLINNFKK